MRGVWRSSQRFVSGRNEARAFLFAFDLLELDGLDMREPIETRKATLASILRKNLPGVRLNEFQHACNLRAKGIVSERLGSRYRSGRSPDWLKFKNPDAHAVSVRRRRIGQNERRQSLESAGGILPQLSRCVIQCLGSLKYRLGQEYPQV
jgi:ATP-dependent DNA ligase